MESNAAMSLSDGDLAEIVALVAKDVQDGGAVAPPLDWVTFLEATPPGKVSRITGSYPTRLHCFCQSDDCNDSMFFSYTGSIGTRNAGSNLALDYKCCHCGKSTKTFAIRIISKENDISTLIKLGEYPAFGPPTPRKLLDLLANNKDIYLKGRQSENQGLGIGAFAYYRRVVENHKGELITEIIKVAKRENAPMEIIGDLTAALNETQFSAAVKRIKHGIPSSLLIDGHNPLTLLHDALSEGLHAESDEVCLKMAEAIRRILIELSSRTTELLKKDAELTEAISQLLHRKQGK